MLPSDSNTSDARHGARGGRLAGCGRSRRGGRRRSSHRIRAALAAWACLLQRLEVDKREIVREDSGHLVRFRLREIALRLDDEKARRHPDLESLSLGIEPLLRKLARRARRLDALAVHLDLPPGVADLLHCAGLGALQAILGLHALELRTRVVGFLGARADWIADAHANRPRRVLIREQLVENVAELRYLAGADDDAGEAARAQDLRAA